MAECGILIVCCRAVEDRREPMKNDGASDGYGDADGPQALAFLPSGVAGGYCYQLPFGPNHDEILQCKMPCDGMI